MHARASLTPKHLRAAAVFCLTLLSLNPVASSAVDVAEVPAARASNLHRWGALTLFHGLPSDGVRAIAQDADGVMWFGTDAGLARYDGRRTQTVSDEALAARRVLALAFDAGGALWVGTDAGAAVRAAAGGEFRTVLETAGKSVTAIHAPAADRAWLATADGNVLDCRARADGSFEVRPLAERLTAAGGKGQPLELTSLAAAGEGVLVGTRGRGLVLVERGAVKEISTRPRAFFVEALARDGRGRLALGAQVTDAEGGLFGADAASPIPAPSKIGDGATGTVTALAFDRGGDLLAGTGGHGVFRYRDGRRVEHFTFEGTAGGLRSNRVYAVFVDREGVAWFGTSHGVCRYDPRGLRVEAVSNETEGNFVRSLYRARDGRLLCGTSRGLFVRDEAAARGWRAVEGLADRTIYAVAETARGRLLVGTASGLYAGARADAQADAWAGRGRADAGSVRAIATLGATTYLATYGRGVERLDEATGQRALVWPVEGVDDARGREVVSLYADDAGGRLWIGTANAGLFYFDGRGVRAEPALAALSRSTVWGVAGSARGWLWLATARGLYAYREGRGLLEIAPGVDARGVVAAVSAANSDTAATSNTADRGAATSAKRDSVAATPDGAATPDSDAATHGGELSPPQAWCATAGEGVIRVTIDEQFGAVTARLDAEQGLPSQSAFAVLRVDEKAAGGGSLLVGTTRGLARYEPGDVPPALRLTRVTASRTYQPEELSGGGVLRLEYPQRGLALDAAATSSRTFPEHFRYGFLLYDDAGQVVKRKLSHDSQFQAENLAPGRYRVVARAYTIDLTPSAPLAFDFEVARAPFPWRTTVLSVLLALALAALVWAAVQHRKVVRAGRALLDANRQLAAARLQLASEAESERRRIARDLHDQTLADLRRLLLLTDEMQPDGAVAAANGGGAGGTAGAGGARPPTPPGPTALRAEIESISQEIRRICEDLSPSVLENVGFTAALEWALTSGVAHLPADCRVACEFACDDRAEERLRLSPVEQMQIYRIVQEAVSNTCRHARAARVRLAVSLTDGGDFLLKLEDDGRGFDAENKKALRGRGLAGIRARAAMIDAEVNWARREGGGTRFTLRKPQAARGEAGAREAVTPAD